MTTLLLALGLSAPLAESAARPGPVRDVQYLGADHLSGRELGGLTGVRPGDRMDPRRNEEGRQAVLLRYHDDGRFFATVELTEGGRPFDTRVVYTVVEGPVVRVAEVRFRGNRQVGAADLLAAKQAGGVSVGAKFRPALLGEDAAAVTRYYAGLGLPGTQVTPEVVRSPDPTRVTVVYHIAEGRK